MRLSEMSIAHGRLNIGMPEELLYSAKIHAMSYPLSRSKMSQVMEANPLQVSRFPALRKGFLGVSPGRPVGFQKDVGNTDNPI